MKNFTVYKPQQYSSINEPQSVYSSDEQSSNIQKGVGLAVTHTEQ